VTTPGGLDLARVTIVAPQRRLDVALPNTMVVAELLPYLLRHAGDDLGDVGDRQGGWVLRRATGTLLEPGRNLAAQGVRDGELLHLAPGRDDWPELAYDDVVEVIASSARRAARSWGAQATRRCGLAVASVLLALGLAVLARSGPPWTVPGVTALVLALALGMAGILLSRAFADAVAGAVVMGCALPYAFAGGALLVAPEGAGITGFAAPSVLLGSALLVLWSVLGYTGVSAVHRLFMAGIGIGVIGAGAALLTLRGASVVGAAAMALTVALGLLPAYPLVASWLGRVPMPALPARAEDILTDHPRPPRADVFTAVARTTELLTGMLLAAAVTSAVAIALLTTLDSSPRSVALCVAGGAALLLRARLFAAPQQRLPLLVGGLIGVIWLGVAAASRATAGSAPLVALGVLVLVAVVVLAAGLRFGSAPPSPYLGRAADILDVVAIMALIPLACWMLGVFDAVQSRFADIGG
jgi:type VII secretion integral membrane protein EccD